MTRWRVEGTEDDGSVLVQCVATRAETARALLSRACSATGVDAKLEVFAGPGSLFRALYAARGWGGADLVFSRGPYLAAIAVRAELLEPYQPAGWPPGGLAERVALATHHPEWYWTAFEFLPFTVLGEPSLQSFDALDEDRVPRLALPDPLRAEVGHFALLAMNHRAHALEYDAWAWWDRRAEAGMLLTEQVGDAVAAVQDGSASHALALAGAEMGGVPGRVLSGIAPVPNAAALARGAPHPEGARRLLDWLAGPEAAEIIDARGQGAISARNAESNGLGNLIASAPPLDVEWATGFFLSMRERWAEEKRFSEWPFEAR